MSRMGRPAASRGANAAIGPETRIPRLQPGELLDDLRPRGIGVERHVHDAGEQAGEVGEHPVGTVRSHVRDTIARPKARGIELAGQVHRRGGKLAPCPRPRLRLASHHREAVDECRAFEGIAENRLEQADERGRRRDGRQHLAPARGHGRRHGSLRSKSTAMPCPRPMHIVARPSRFSFAARAWRSVVAILRPRHRADGRSQANRRAR